MAVYLDLLAAARGFYARREGDDWLATYSAGLLLAALLGVNVSTSILLADALANPELVLTPWILSHKLQLIPFILAIAVLHVFLAARRRGTDSESSRTRLRRYVIGSGIYFLLGIGAAVATVE